MNITFGPRHINTLIKLKEIADRHNCVISFGTNDCGSEILIDDFKPYFKDLTDEICEYVNDNYTVLRSHDKSSHYWFELYDKEKEKYNTLTYTELDMLIEFDTPSAYVEYNMPDEVEDWFLNNQSWDDAIAVETSDQKIRGFEGVDTTDINVYREGMALKFFGDLVCDYLGEPRIEEVY